MTDENETREQGAEQERAFQERHGYYAYEIPDAWVGQNVTIQMLGGKDHQHGPGRQNGMLEAIREEGFVISAKDRVVFIPRGAVLQMELHDPTRRGSTLTTFG